MFCIISFYFYLSKQGFCICFFNCPSCKCGQLSHYYIKCDLGNQNFGSATIVMPLFRWRTSGIHIFKLRLQKYSCTPQEPTSWHIHAYSRTYLQKVVIRRFLNLLLGNFPIANIPNSAHAMNSGEKIPYVTIFLKLPPNSGHFSRAEKFLKTDAQIRRCPLFRSFTVFDSTEEILYARENF